MEWVPRRAHLVTGKGVLGRMAFGNHCAIELLNRDPLRGEHRSLIWSPIRQNRRAFLMQPHGHASWRRVLQDSFESKKAAASHNRGFDFLKLIPALDAAVSVENVCKQLVHQIPFSLTSRAAFFSQPEYFT